MKIIQKKIQKKIQPTKSGISGYDLANLEPEGHPEEFPQRQAMRAHSSHNNAHMCRTLFCPNWAPTGQATQNPNRGKTTPD